MRKCICSHSKLLHDASGRCKAKIKGFGGCPCESFDDTDLGEILKNAGDAWALIPPELDCPIPLGLFGKKR